MPRVNPIQHPADDNDLHLSEIELVDNSSERDNSDIDSTNSLQHPTDYSYSETELESDSDVDIEDTNSLSDNSEGDNSDIDSIHSPQQPTDYSYSDTETESYSDVDIEDTNSLSDSSEGDNSEELTITDNADTDNFVGNINLNNNHHTARNYRLYRNENLN